jgi:nitrate/TMAO reductase-like tetraheme cytochrome c subunit
MSKTRSKPSNKHRIVAGAVLFGAVLGILLWGGFNNLVAHTNTTEFCISCHELRNTVYQEYQKSVHFKNASGVRVGCPDCHVPRPWGAKMLRKIQASNDIYHKIIGSIDSPEKFEAKRMQLAERVWSSMEASDSRECRNCHSYEAMDFKHQSRRGAKKMNMAMNKGKTCIECHKGIAHELPVEYAEDDG